MKTPSAVRAQQDDPHRTVLAGFDERKNDNPRHNGLSTGRPWLSLALSLFVALAGLPCLAQEGSFVTTSDGARIHFRKLGTGVPIFLIAGGPGGGGDRLRLTHTLLRDCGQLIYLDNRGRGRSKAPESDAAPYTLEKDLQDIEAVRLALGAEKIVVFGHSCGSMVAMAYAARHPKNTLALLTTAGVQGAGAWQERNIDGVKRFLRLHYPDRWARIVKLHDAGKRSGEGELAELFRGVDELYYYHPESVRRVEEQFDDSRDVDSIRFNKEVYLAMIGADPEWTLDGTLKDVELLPELPNFQGPALIMGGRFDRVCPPINQHEIAAALPNARLVIFERSGHAPFLEEPLRFLTVVAEFLREVTKTSAE